MTNVSPNSDIDDKQDFLFDELYHSANTDVRENQAIYTHRFDFDAWADSHNGSKKIREILGFKLSLGKKKLADNMYSYSNNYAGKMYIAYVAGLYFPCALLNSDTFDFRRWAACVGFRYVARNDDRFDIYRKLMLLAFKQGREVARDPQTVIQYFHDDDFPRLSLVSLNNKGKDV